MTWRRLAAAVAIFLSLEVAAFAVFINRLYDELEFATWELERETNDYLSKKRMAVNLDAYRQQLREIDRMFGATLIELPDRHERSFTEVRSAANARGLRVEVLATGKSDWLREFYCETPARLVVTGRYHQVGAFLADLGRQPRSMRVNNFVVERSSQPGMVTMKGVVSIYRYLSEEEIAAARKKAEAKP